MDIVATIIGYVLFSMSEILPFINIPTNGILHTLLLGFSNAFKNPTKDIELAEALVSKPDFAHIVNTISTNPQIKILIDSLIANPQLSNTLHTIISGNNTLNTQLPVLTSRPQLQTILTALINDPQFCNNIATITYNPQLLNNYFQNKDVYTSANLTLLHSLDPQSIDTITNILNNTDNKHNILNIIDILNSHPDLIPNIHQLAKQAIV